MNPSASSVFGIICIDRPQLDFLIFLWRGASTVNMVARCYEFLLYLSFLSFLFFSFLSFPFLFCFHNLLNWVTLGMSLLPLLRNGRSRTVLVRPGLPCLLPLCKTMANLGAFCSVFSIPSKPPHTERAKSQRINYRRNQQY